MPSHDTRQIRAALQAQAQRLEIDRVGYAPVAPPPQSLHLPEWLQRGYAGTMHWLEDRAEVLMDPRTQFDWAKTLVVATMRYDHPESDAESDAVVHRISRYARGRDYHTVFGKRLRKLGHWLQDTHGAMTRAFVDASPLMERQHAVAAGLGWQGKHTLLIHPQDGSYFFLGILLIDIDLIDEMEPIEPDHCGTCTRCIDACPTDAIVQPYVLDATRCISYLNIEAARAEPDTPPRHTLDGWLHGCDICQEVCPWVQKAQQRGFGGHEAFQPKAHWQEMTLDQLDQWDAEAYDTHTLGSPIRRQTYTGFQRNLAALQKNDDPIGE